MNKTSLHASLSDSELLEKTARSAKTQKEATLELLEDLLEVDKRRLYATLSCSSLWDYLRRGLFYSEMQCSELVNTVRLMKTLPEVKAQIQAEEISITTASQIQRFINQEKKAGNPISAEKTAEVLDACKGLSKRELEKALFGFSSEPAKILNEESVKTVTESLTELKFLVSDSTLEVLSEVKNLVGNEALSKIFDQSLRIYLEAEKKKRGRSEKTTVKPTVKKVPPAADPDAAQDSTFPGKLEAKPRSRFISIKVISTIAKRSGGQCEYVNPETQVRCSSRYRLQLDHHPVPFCKGGENTVEGLRHLCSSHNLRTAMEAGIHHPK